MEASIKATIDDLNQYLQGNPDVTAMGLIITLEDMIEFIKDSENIYENKTMENLNEGKKKSPSYMAELAEIDKQSAIVAMEAKINHLQEMADKKKGKLKMVSEDENLSDLIDPKRKKMMEREIKEIEKAKMKLEKLYEKMSGGKKKEVVKEDPSDEDMDHQDALDKASAEGSTEFMEEGNDPGEDTGIANLDGVLGNYMDEGKEETNEEMNRWQKLAGL